MTCSDVTSTFEFEFDLSLWKMPVFFLSSTGVAAEVAEVEDDKEVAEADKDNDCWEGSAIEGIFEEDDDFSLWKRLVFFFSSEPPPPPAAAEEEEEETVVEEEEDRELLWVFWERGIRLSGCWPSEALRPFASISCIFIKSSQKSQTLSGFAPSMLERMRLAVEQLPQMTLPQLRQW